MPETPCAFLASKYHSHKMHPEIDSLCKMHTCAYVGNLRGCTHNLCAHSIGHVLIKHTHLVYMQTKPSTEFASDIVAMALLEHLESFEASGNNFMQTIHFMQCV